MPLCEICNDRNSYWRYKDYGESIMAKLFRVASSSIRRRLAAAGAATSSLFGTATFCSDDETTGTGRFA